MSTHRRHAAGSLHARMAAFGRHVLATLVLAGLTGCASCPPFRAAWYLEEGEATAKPATQDQAAAPPVILLALLNEGKEAVNLERIMVNPEGTSEKLWDRVMPSSAPVGSYMEITHPDPVQPAKASKLLVDGWRPGELLVFKLKDTRSGNAGRSACSLPVSVYIECDNGCRKTQAVSGVLPNYLHKSWLDNCQPLRKPPW